VDGREKIRKGKEIEKKQEKYKRKLMRKLRRKKLKICVIFGTPH
jgi:hypothetical protein